MSEASEYVGEKTRKGSSGPQAEERARRKEPEEDTTLYSVTGKRNEFLEAVSKVQR